MRILFDLLWFHSRINFKGYIMQLNTHGNTLFKGATKNLAKELTRQGFEVTHSNALNIMAVALGYKNYNTYKALIEEKQEMVPTTMRDLKEASDRRMRLLYPSIKERFVNFPKIKSEQLNTFIHREAHDEKYQYYIILELKNSTTGRVFYAPSYDAILLFVYPDIKTGINDYVLPLNEIDSHQLYKMYFNDILHLLRTKDWATQDLLQDIMELMEHLVIVRDSLRDINKNKVDSNELELLFNSDFS